VKGFTTFFEVFGFAGTGAEGVWVGGGGEGFLGCREAGLLVREEGG
jgi:hypothetical protein